MYLISANDNFNKEIQDSIYHSLRRKELKQGLLRDSQVTKKKNSDFVSYGLVQVPVKIMLIQMSKNTLF